jgi:diguanylate cyclase
MKSKFFDNLDFDKINLILEGFNKATGFVTAILDLEGNILSKSGWRPICTEFHRKNPQTALNCRISDTMLANSMAQGERYHFYECKNGLVDVAVPIMIEGEQVANLFSGQFFFEPPDLNFFKKQAANYGFDESDYLDALSKVPIVSREEVKTNMDFLLTITQMITEMTYDKLEQKELNDAFQKSDEALRESQVTLEQSIKDLLASQEIAHVGTWRLDLATNQVVWSEELYKMYGFDPTIPPPPYTEHMKLFTPASWENLSTALDHTRNTGIPYELELETITADGSNGWMWVRGEANKDIDGNIISLWGAAQDITERKKIVEKLRSEEDLLINQNNLLSSLLKVMPIGVFMVEADTGKPLVANETAKDLLGRGILPDATKDNLTEVYEAYKFGTQEQYPTHEMPIVRGMHGENSHIDDMVVRRPDGSERLLEVFGTSVPDANGNPWASLVTFADITERKQMEMQLRESEERFKLLFDKAPLGYQSLDIEGNFLEVNQKWLDIFGYQREEVIGKWFGDFLALEYKDAFRERFPIFKEQGYIHSEFEMIGKSGDKMFIAFDGKIGHADNGAFEQTHCILKDITMETALARELAENRELMQAIIENTTDAIYVKDLEGKYLLANHVVEEVTGKTKSELIGKDDYALFSAPEAEVIMQADREICKTGTARTFEEIVTDKIGKANYYSSTKGPIRDLEDNVIGLFGIARNITERKELDLQIEQERKLMQATLISVGDGVISCDIGGNVQFMNPAAERLTGWTQEEARGQEIEEVFKIYNEMTGEKSESITRLVFETGNIVGLANHTVLISKKGEKRPIEDCAAPIIMENGEIIGVVIVFSDFSEKRKRMNEIEFLSYHDYLTGLYNRRFFEEELKRHDVSRNLPISIVMGDVNGLKLINDSFGHPTGDELLKKAAELIVKACRADDIVARLGGDEFVVLLPKAGEEDAARLIKRVQTELIEENFSGIPLSVSFGQATKTQGEESMNELLKGAEDHMYRHKLNESTGARSRTVTLIINTLYAKNHREMLHSQRVGELSADIATYMGYEKDDVNQIKTAGLMHDIGKIGVQDSILNKTEPLNQQEWEEIKKHSEVGYRILSSVPEFSEIANFVLEHQERWDGKGYPRGLKGDEISQEARIIAVADSYDAMTGERSYGRVFTQDEAVQELLHCAGTQFDPKIVNAFVKKLHPEKAADL